METAKIQGDWSQLSHRPSEAEIRTAALLASSGPLTSVEYLNIVDIDITDIPRDQLKKLASIVTGGVVFDNLTHTQDLSSILASVLGYGCIIWT